MPTARTNDIETYYERRGEGHPLVLIHGGWVDHRMWNPQVEMLADDFELIVYDVRGHGRTGGSERRRYTVDLLADDLRALVDALDLQRPYVCGLSLGGMIAQTYAVRYPDALGALVLADTAVSTRLTLSDKIQSLLFPKRAMTGTVGLLGPRRWVDVAFWLAKVTRSSDWFGRSEAVEAYVRETMSRFDTAEYNKIFGAIYDFRLLDLERIAVPTLVINGEHESESVFRHTEELRRRVPDATTAVIPDAGHTSNMENPAAFTETLRTFLLEIDAEDA